MEPKPKFEVTSSLGKRIRISDEYWRTIIETKHPVMARREELVKLLVKDRDGKVIGFEVLNYLSADEAKDVTAVPVESAVVS